MEELLTLLETARAERAASLKDFVRLKAELARVQRRVDELRSENRELKVALHAAETEVVNLHAYVGEIVLVGEA
jgi:predicted nuclease with TOPRIM domain